MKFELLEKIENTTMKIGIIGLGYVGLPLAITCAKAGYKTIGFDVSSDKVDLLSKKKNYIDDVKEHDLNQVIEKQLFSATTDFSKLSYLDLIIICVPTPLDQHQQPNTRYIEEAGHMIGTHLTAGSIIVLESTTYPGTTRDLLKPCLEKSGLVCEKDYFLGFSPERVDPGNQDYNTENTPKIVGAIGEEASEVIAKVYETILDGDIHIVSSPEIAEMEKILENTYRNVNIGLINEMAVLCHKLEIDIWEVIEAAKSKPYGFQAFYPGPGLGGHCIPLDPYYLSWKAREYSFHTSMIESSMSVNDQMPDYTVQRLSTILNEYQKSLNGSRILIIGVAYKKDISDYRESPALTIMERLKKEKACLEFYDPYVSALNKEEIPCKQLVKLTPKTLTNYDLVVILTDHTCIDYEMVQKNSTVVFDTRNATKNVKNKDNIILL